MIWLVLTIGVAAIVLLLLLAMIFYYKDKPMPPTDYYNLFVIGICWLPLGIIGLAFGKGFQGLSAFFVMGLIFMGVGLYHKDEWKANHKDWKHLSKEDRKFKMYIMIGLGVLLLLGVAVFALVRFLN